MQPQFQYILDAWKLRQCSASLSRGQQIFQQVVEGGKLLGQHLGLHKALCHKHVLHDQLPVRQHDGDGPEQGLQASEP